VGSSNGNIVVTINGVAANGVIYFGHSGPFAIIVQGKVLGIASLLEVGQAKGPDTNVGIYNIGTLSNVLTANSGGNILGTNAAMLINGCNAGLSVYDIYARYTTSIAQWISNTVKRGVYAYDVGMYFSQKDADHDKFFNGTDAKGNSRPMPNSLPMYMIPEGTPGQKPRPFGFTPY